MAGHDDFVRLVDLVYAAACSQDKWSEFWGEFARAMHATTAHVIVQGSTAGADLQSVLSGDSTASDLFNRYYCNLDPWFSAAAKGITTVPNPFVGDALVSASQLRRTEFYSDFGRRYDLVRPLTIASANPDLFAVSVLRGEAGLPWSESDVKFAMAVEPHVRRASEVHVRLHTATVRSATLEDALDRMSVGLLILDKKNRIIFANRAALDLHNARDGFDLGRDGPGATHRVVAPAVARAIAEAIAEPKPGGPPPGVVSLPRPSGRRPYVLTVSPARDLGASSDAAAVLVMVVDPARAPNAGATELDPDYGLTRAEIEVASALAQGRSISETAALRGVSIETVRSQTKAAMSKCGVRRQSDLVRLISTLSIVRDRSGS